MPEFIHNFTKGKMNKDLDERLVPNGEYRDALNLDLANSDASDVGTMQNIAGNLEIRSKVGTGATWTGGYIDSMTNPVCIGSYRNDINERIYWFIASDNVSAIAEYDEVKNTVSPVLVDKNGILNFSTDYLITGINVIDKFLFWTDDQTEPKKINIEKFKTGSTDFATQSKIPKWEPNQDSYNTNLSGRPDFVEADITTIKLSPLTAPTLFTGASAFDNPGQTPQPGTGLDPLTTSWGYLDLENFTYKPNIVINPTAYQSLPTYAQYLDLIEENDEVFANSSLNTDNSELYPNGSNTAPYWDGRVTFQVNQVPGNALQVGEILILSGELVNQFGPNDNYEISLKIYAINGTSITGEIQAISRNINKSLDSEGEVEAISWDVLLVEKKPLFEYVFPRFAYRWKYIDNEYSCYSPFSPVAFIGNDFEYLSSDGYNVGMTNNIRKLIVQDLVWNDDEISEIDILYKESSNTAVYVVDTLKKSDYQNTTLPTEYEIKTELIGAVVEANQLLRPWDNVPRKAKSQEIIGNRIVYGNYLQNYSTVGVVNETTGEISTPVKLNTTLFSTEYPDLLINDEGATVSTTLPYASLKSIRTYQAGVVYKDAYGRETPVFTSENSGLQVDIVNSSTVNKLAIQPTNVPPSWATHYKFFVKETSNEYYNLALDRYYLAEDGNVWLSFPSSERNKITEESYLILKKQHDNNVAVKELNRYKILAIDNSAPDFISKFDNFVASRIVTAENEIEPGRITIEFRTAGDPGDTFRGGLNSSANKLTITYQGITSNKYDISGSTPSDTNQSYDVVLSQPLGNEVPNIPDGDSLTITIYEEVTKRLPEFEGRFFAKINRDFAFDTNVIDSFNAQTTDYAVVDEIDFKSPVANGSGYSGSYHYGDKGNSLSKDFCASTPGRYRLLGWTGNGVAYGTRMGDERDFGYTPPTRTSNKFGYVFVGRRNGIADKMTGRILSGQLTSPNGTINPGAKIRFANNDPNAEYSDKLSRPYTIIETRAKQSARGGMQRPNRNNCFDRNQDFNWKYAVMITLDKPISESWMPNANEWDVLEQTLPSIQLIQPVYEGGNKVLTSSNPAIFETEPKESIDLDLYYEASNAFPISEYNTEKTLDWFNCYIYGQGVESNRIRDDYNAPFIDKGPKVSTVLDAPYSAERRGSGFIFSQMYNSTSGINRLNQFIQAEPITKDLNPIHGTIQKLHARDTDLITLCEDKCFRVLANKDALFNADGNANLTSNQAVLGQTVPYAGEFGISKNPESFASYGFRSYFTDKNRGAVIRLSMDGITNIAEKGMSSFFADNLRTATTAVGSYDDDKDIYNLTLNNLSNYWQKRLSLDAEYQLDPDCKDAPDSLVPSTTLSFKESVDGWTGRKSFIQESGITLNNNYYTFKQGRLWMHGVNTLHNNFYGIQYDSSFNVLINEMPQVVKGFSTLNYTGTASRIYEYQSGSEWYSIAEVNANQIIPQFSQIKKHGWYTSFVRTDLEAGIVKEFQKKEGKYFNYIKGTLIGCEPDGNGIGPCLDCGEETPQDYLLTVTIDETCSSSGSPTPDTDFEGWYQWNAKGKTSSILEAPTAQDAKCIIDDFYTYVNGGYSSVTLINYNQFKYVFSEGISVGTQMYDKDTLQPITEAGTYLWIKPPPIGSAPDSPSLDPDNATTVPNTYFIVIWGSDGIIVSVTPYSSLTVCSPPNPDMFRVFNHTLKANNSDPQIPSFNVTYGHTSTENFLCGLRSFMNSFWEQYDDPNINGPNQGWSSFNIFWSGPGEIEVGTILYVDPTNLNVASDRYLVTGPGEGVFEYYIEFDAANRWTDVSSLPNGYKLIKTNSTGVVTEITQMNQIPNPPCT